MGDVIHLLKRFLQQELRNTGALFSLGLYLVGITYLIYLLTQGQSTSDSVWNVLLWTTVFFGTVQLSLRSFYFESDNYFIYLQTLVRPEALIFAKLLFNALYMMLLSVATWMLFSLFFSNNAANWGQFLLSLLLGTVGFSSVLTLTSGIASRTNGNHSLSTILAIPLLLPVLKMTSVLNLQSMVGASWETSQSLILSMIALDLAIGLLAYLLFPYIWQD